MDEQRCRVGLVAGWPELVVARAVDALLGAEDAVPPGTRGRELSALTELRLRRHLDATGPWSRERLPDEPWYRYRAGGHVVEGKPTAAALLVLALLLAGRLEPGVYGVRYQDVCEALGVTDG